MTHATIEHEGIEYSATVSAEHHGRARARRLAPCRYGAGTNAPSRGRLMILRGSITYSAALDTSTPHPHTVRVYRDGVLLGTGRWCTGGFISVFDEALYAAQLPVSVTEALESALRRAITDAVAPGLDALERQKRERAIVPEED